MKKGKYWFSKLSHKQKKDFKKAFINTYINNGPYFKMYLNRDHQDFKFFIYGAFDFNSSTQGHEYWNKIAFKKVK